MQTWNNHQILLTIRIIFWRAITKLLNILLFSSVIFSAASLENNPVNKSFSVQFCIFSFYWIHCKSILEGRASEHQLHLYYSPQHQVSSKVLIKFSNFFWTSCLYLFFPLIVLLPDHHTLIEYTTRKQNHMKRRVIEILFWKWFHGRLLTGPFPNLW